MIRLPPALEKALGLAEISDDLLDDALTRVKTRCAAVDLSAYRRVPAQVRLEIEAVEAIIGAFRDHHPDRDIRIRNGWPHVGVTLKGQRATFSPWLGQDYAGDDGIEPFDIQCPTFKPPRDFGSVVRKMMDRLKKVEPEMVLRQPERTPERTVRTPVQDTVRTERPKAPAAAGKVTPTRSGRK